MDVFPKPLAYSSSLSSDTKEKTLQELEHSVAFLTEKLTLTAHEEELLGKLLIKLVSLKDQFKMA